MKTSDLYPLLFDAIKDPLILCDLNGVVLVANAAAVSFFDFGATHTVRSMRCTELDCVIDTAEIGGLMRSFDSVRDYSIKNPRGGDCGITLDIDNVHKEGGAGEYKLLHFHNRSTEQRNELWRDQMISMVSHEIKNPLSAMKNSVDILLSQVPGDLTEGQKRFLDTSGRSIDRLTHLLDGFLDVSRINSGAFDLRRVGTDVHQFIREVMESFTTIFNVRRVSLDWYVAPSVARAHIDKAKLEQVVINLLSNALKFTPEKGRIDVSVSTAGVEKTPDELRLLPWDVLGLPNLLEIVVEDDGLGMSSETIDHLFSRYYNPSGREEGKGAHLGLNISKTLLEAQDGWLDIVSQLGIGTKVSVYVPSDRHTACVLSRMRRICDLVDRALAARRRLILFAMGKQDGENWEDICNSWRRVPVINPDREAASRGTFHLWTINAELSVAALLVHDGETAESVFGPQYVEKEDRTYVFPSYAVGECTAPDEATSFAQLCNIAIQRMNVGRDAVIRSAVETMAAEIESIVVDLGS